MWKKKKKPFFGRLELEEPLSLNLSEKKKGKEEKERKEKREGGMSI